MWWFLVSFVVIAGFLGALYRLSRSDGGGPENMPPIVPSGREVHRARAWEQLMKGNGHGNGPGDMGCL